MGISNDARIKNGLRGTESTVGKLYKGVDNIFKDYSNLFLPKTLKDVYMLSEYFYLTNSVLRGSIRKLAEYAITSLDFSSITDNEVRKKWVEILTKDSKLRAILFTTGVDNFAYGESFVIPVLPFKREYKCNICGAITYTIEDIKSHKWVKEKNSSRSSRKNKKKKENSDDIYIRGVCPECNRTAKLTVIDKKMHSDSASLGFRNLHPSYFTIKENMYSDYVAYYMEIDKSISSEIRSYSPEIFDTTRKEIIDAVFEKKALKINKKNIYHFKNEGITSTMFGPHGESSAMSAFKDMFFSQILKHMQEVIGIDRSAGYRGVNVTDSQYSVMGNQKKHIEKEIKLWRDDPNHVAFFPVPVKFNNFSGEARNLFLSGEINASNDNAIIGLEVPREFVYGSIGNYTAASISLRMLENRFVIYVNQLNEFIRDFLVKKMATYYGMDYKTASGIKLKKFKMADDNSYKQSIFNMSERDYISKKTVVESTTDFDYQSEQEQIELEKKEQARIQAEVSMLMNKSQADASIAANIEAMKAQKKMQEGKVVDDGFLPISEAVYTPERDLFLKKLRDKIKKDGVAQAAPYIIVMSEQSPEMLDRYYIKYPEDKDAIESILFAYKQQSTMGMPPPEGSAEAGAIQPEGATAGPQNNMPAAAEANPGDVGDVSRQRPPKV